MRKADELFSSGSRIILKQVKKRGWINFRRIEKSGWIIVKWMKKSRCIIFKRAEKSGCIIFEWINNNYEVDQEKWMDYLQAGKE